MTGPASMPSEETVAQVILDAGFHIGTSTWPREQRLDAVEIARAIMALFAPILADQDKEIEHFARLAFDDLGKNPPVAWKDRALAAEAALAGERERCAKIAEDHGELVSNEPIGKACSRNIAAAIRAGE